MRNKLTTGKSNLYVLLEVTRYRINEFITENKSTLFVKDAWNYATQVKLNLIL